MTTPTLTLPFSKIKRLDPRIAFTRGSSGTYFDYTGTLKTAAINQPRFNHNPDTLDSLGLLTEESRTNLVTYSEQFDNAAWTKTRSSITANSTTAPDGTATADRLVEDATASNTHLVSVAPTVAVSTVHTISIFAKAGTRTAFDLVIGQGASYTARNFNLSTGLTETNKSGMNDAGTSNSSMTALPNDWYLCTVTMNLTQASSAGVAQIILTNGANAVYSGDGASYLFIWGAQVEAGAFATSYIQTTSAQVTRAADVASMAGTNFSSWWNPTEGTFVCEFDYQGATASSFGLAYQVSDGTANNKAGLASYSPSINRAYEFVTSGGASVFDASGQAQNNFSFNEKNKSAFAFKSNDFASSRNGSSPYLDTSGAIPAVNTLNLGGNYGAGQVMCGHISTLIYFPKRLSDTALAILST